MKILVFTTVFPNEKQPTLGIFVRERMFRVAQRCELQVLAPVPWFPFSEKLKPGYRPAVSRIEVQEGIKVHHPRFFSIPRFGKVLDGLFLFIAAAVTARRIRREFDFDLIDAHFLYPDGVAASLLGRFFRRPVLITARESDVERQLCPVFRGVQVRLALKAASGLIAVCSSLAERIAAVVSPRCVTVVGNGVDLDKFHQLPQEEARTALGLPLKARIVISVGWLIERKGFHRVIAALPEILPHHPDLLYVVVGAEPHNGGYESQLIDLIQSLGLGEHVRLAGGVPHHELHRWLSAADVFCLATSGEGWANVFLEAMACGLPVVASNVGGNAEVVASEDLGILFDLNRPQQLAAALDSALEREWDRERILSHARNNGWSTRVDLLLQRATEVSDAYAITMK
jgi:glycosyltransferase involved in cell wall biosynthesis